MWQEIYFRKYEKVVIMDKLKELYTLIGRTDFALNIERLDYEDSEITFDVEGTQYSVLYLSGEIELKDSKFIMDCTLEMYSVDNDTTWKKEYPIENIGEIINDLSIAISRLADFNRQVDKYYEKFNVYKFPQSSAWKKEFVENLTHKFGGSLVTIYTAWGLLNYKFYRRY